VHTLAAAQSAGISQMVLLSALCVQGPLLAFQHAKLALEAALMESGVAHTIVRPMALSKLLSGQVDRVKRGKPFPAFGDDTLPACKPISDANLGAFLTDGLEDPGRRRHAVFWLRRPAPGRWAAIQGTTTE